MNWSELILQAQRAGFTVSEDDIGWWVTTPHWPRRPSEQLGVWKDCQAAWRGAALINAQFAPQPVRNGHVVD